MFLTYFFVSFTDRNLGKSRCSPILAKMFSNSSDDYYNQRSKPDLQATRAPMDHDSWGDCFSTYEQ